MNALNTQPRQRGLNDSRDCGSVEEQRSRHAKS
jgi:hypothetical protein